MNTSYKFDKTNWRIYLNSGSGFDLNRILANSERSGYSSFADLLGKGIVNWTHAESDGKVVITDFGYGLNKNTITKVSDPFQGDQNIQYKTLADCTEYDNLIDNENKNYTATDYLALGFQPFKTSSFLVTSRYENGARKTAYHYGTALMNWHVRGFVGFRFLGIDDELTGISTFTYNKLYSSQYLMMPQRAITSMGFTISKSIFVPPSTYGSKIYPTNAISQDDYAYSVSSLGNNRFKVQQTKLTSFNYLTDKTRAEDLGYDNNGNLILLYKDFGDAISEEQQFNSLLKDRGAPIKSILQ